MPSYINACLTCLAATLLVSASGCTSCAPAKFLVLDGQTNEPIAGAIVSAHSPYVGRLIRPDCTEVGVTDAFGVAVFDAEVREPFDVEIRMPDGSGYQLSSPTPHFQKVVHPKMLNKPQWAPMIPDNRFPMKGVRQVELIITPPDSVDL